MITIKTLNGNNAELTIKKGTPHITMLLGVEMLVEYLTDTLGNNIDDVLDDIKRIYLRDKEKENG